MDEPNKWEVWLADVRFEDKPEISKSRLVIVFAIAYAVAK